MFRSDFSPPVEPVNIFLNGGGVGDHIAAFPAVRAALKQNIDPTLWVPNFFHEFAVRMFTGLKVMAFRDIELRDKMAAAVQTISSTHSPMRMHLVDYAASMIVDKQLDPEEKNYLKYPVGSLDTSKYNLPERFVVLTPGHTAPVREWSPEIVNSVAAYLIDKDITPVFLGSDQTLSVVSCGSQSVTYKGNFNKKIDYSVGINLINKTSLSEAAEIMAKSLAVVGLDNGLLHLAGCTDAPIVGGFTTVDPKYRMPYRNDILGWNFYPVVPPESLGCRFCQSNWSFVYEHDFKLCYYKERGRDTEIQCTKQVSADKYIDELRKLL